MPRTLKNNDSLLNFFVGREAFSPVWSEGQVVQMGPGDQASQGGPGGQVVRWSGGQGVRWSAGQLVSWSIVVTVLRCGRGTSTRLGAPRPMQWIVGAASVVAAAWRAVAPREVTAAAAFTGAGECWRPGLAVQRAGSQPHSRWSSRPAGEN